MITLKLSPIQINGAEQLSIGLNDFILKINGVEHDLSIVPDGATMNYIQQFDTDHEPLRKIERNGEDYEVTIYHFFEESNNPEIRFPTPIVVTENGTVDLPPYVIEEV